MTESMATMRITHLDLGMEYRGGQRQVLYLASAQHTAGLGVQVAAPVGAPILDMARAQGVSVLALPRRFDFDPRNVLALARHLSPAAMLHSHDARAASLAALVSFFRKDISVLHTRRVSYAPGSGWSRWKYRQGAVICVSQEVAAVMRHAGISPLGVIPSAIVLSRYARRKPGNDGRIGIIGALSPQKGHTQFFQALALLDRQPQVWVVGQGELEAELRALAETLGLGQQIVWKGQVESPEILSWLDVLVVPSAHGEGSSGVIKEGWAAGVPVICSDLPANLELVTHEANGLVFENGHPQSLSRLLMRCLTESPLVQTITDGGLAAVARYDARQMHCAYLEAYNAVRGKRRLCHKPQGV